MTTSISVRNLTFSYPDADSPAVQEVNFDVQSGEIFGLVGTSRAGKSTVLQILAGLLWPYEGEVTVLDESLDAWDKIVYERLGVTLESANLYGKLTALENLSLFRSLYQSETLEPLELMRTVGLEQFAHLRVEHFTAEMQRRLSLARALMHQPDILLLDDPTLDLDTMHMRRIKDVILAQKAEGRTILLATQNLSHAEELCDRVAFMVEGKVVLIDSPELLKNQHSHNHLIVEYRAAHQPESEPDRHARFSLQDIGQNELYLALIRDHHVVSIHTPQATLEDVFVKVRAQLEE